VSEWRQSQHEEKNAVFIVSILTFLYRFLSRSLLDGNEDSTQPMRTSMVESLNVSVAAGILLHALITSGSE